jgi:hypothetical protein
MNEENVDDTDNKLIVAKTIDTSTSYLTVG